MIPAVGLRAGSGSAHRERMLSLGVFNNGWWSGAREAARQPASLLPIAQHSSGNAYASTLEARTINGAILHGIFTKHALDPLIDNGGTGLAFVNGAPNIAGLALAHELARRTLISHFIDPIVTALQGLPWEVVWQSLQSELWVKAVWDRAQVEELRRFGVPRVEPLSMAAPDRDYDTTPLDARRSAPVVSFVGGQNTSVFDEGVTMPTRSQLPAILAHATRGDLPDTTFHEIYHDLYQLAESVRPGEDVREQVRKTRDYFNAKLFYSAALSVRNRDRFVLFLKRKLGERFVLRGKRWDTTYGLCAEPPFPTNDEYFQHFREVAINLNLVNGNAETGLNMRHFEVTAAGGFLLCYQQPELEDHFVVGKEVVVFYNERDLLDKIEYYLARPDERAEIAMAGQRRTLSEHLYSHRLKAILARVAETNSKSAESVPGGSSSAPSVPRDGELCLAGS